MMSDKVRESIQVALEQLHDERERIEGAIAKLEGFLGNLINSATASIQRRGRPAKATNQQPPMSNKRLVAKQRSREGWTAEARQAAAERMRSYWEQRRKAAAEGKVASRKRRSQARNTVANDTRERSRKGWTPEARDAARERMQRYWEQRKKARGVAASG